tara:strand:+ start:626 stop:1000 length:375 start_codon:yes stop_codon:yes gene_type:complete
MNRTKSYENKGTGSKSCERLRHASLMTSKDLVNRLRPSLFRYISLNEAIIIHYVGAADGYVYVIGQANYASYEWVAQVSPEEIVFSNVGYGGVDVALRDGLIVACDDHKVDPALNNIGGRITVK